MERFKSLTTVTWMLASILAFELMFLVWQVRPQAFVLWLTIGVIAISCLYLVVLTLGMLKELKSQTKDKK